MCAGSNFFRSDSPLHDRRRGSSKTNAPNGYCHCPPLAQRTYGPWAAWLPRRSAGDSSTGRTWRYCAAVIPFLPPSRRSRSIRDRVVGRRAMMEEYCASKGPRSGMMIPPEPSAEAGCRPTALLPSSPAHAMISPTSPPTSVRPAFSPHRDPPGRGLATGSEDVRITTAGGVENASMEGEPSSPSHEKSRSSIPSRFSHWTMRCRHASLRRIATLAPPSPMGDISDWRDGARVPSQCAAGGRNAQSEPAACGARLRHVPRHERTPSRATHPTDRLVAHQRRGPGQHR